MGVSGTAVSLAISKSSVAWPSRQWWMEAIVHDILAQGFGTPSEKKFAESMWVKPRVPFTNSQPVGAVESVPS